MENNDDVEYCVICLRLDRKTRDDYQCPDCSAYVCANHYDEDTGYCVDCSVSKNHDED